MVNIGCSDGTASAVQRIELTSTRPFIWHGELDPDARHLSIEGDLYWVAEIVSETELDVVYVGDMQR